jgi:uncharacterized protein YdhG (YjbR/CyaY superfamily)
MAKRQLDAVDAYISRQPKASQTVLKRVRHVIRRALPGAEEALRYQIPTFRLDGRAVVYFAGWKQHWSLYPVTAAVREAVGAALEAYPSAKGTLRFPLSEPVPTRLVEQIVRALARAAETRGKTRTASKRASRSARVSLR